MSDLGLALQSGALLESLGHALVDRAVALNAFTAALLGGALVLDRALSRRARASWRIALYAPIALRIVLPLDWSVWSLPLASSPRVATLFAPLSIIGGQGSTDGSPAPTLSWHALAAVAYVAVALALAARAVLSRARLQRALDDAQPADGVRADVSCAVVQHDHLGPMVFGLFAPRIVLPRRLLADGEELALACVLGHESAHLRRRDPWLSAAMQLLAVVAWPILPLWIAMARVRQLVELACDEAALTGADTSQRRRYGHALLDIAEWRAFGTAPLGAGELHFGSTLRARIEALASQRHWPIAAQALALSLAPVALLAACGASASAPTPVTAATVPAAADDDKGYGYEFEADPLKEAAATPLLPAGADGRLPPETVQSVVRAQVGALSACYQSGRAKNPSLAGNVVVKFVFGEDGLTREAADLNSTMPDKDVVACVVGVFRGLTYPKAPGGDVTVVYPVQFAP